MEKLQDKALKEAVLVLHDELESNCIICENSVRTRTLMPILKLAIEAYLKEKERGEI